MSDDDKLTRQNQNELLGQIANALSGNDSPLTARDPMRQKRDVLLKQIANACSEHESTATAHFIEMGDLCSTFINLFSQDGGKNSDAVSIVRGKLAETGLRSEDVPAYVKSFALSTLVPSVASVPVSVLMAMLPLVSVKRDGPKLVIGVSAEWVSDLVNRVQTERLGKDQVAFQINKTLGKEN